MANNGIIAQVKGVKKITEREIRIREFRREASRLASLANKRIQRIEKNSLTESPAYKRYIKDGQGKFGVKGKTYQEVQAEVARINRFINAETSTIKGINNELKSMAANTGIEYTDLKDLQKKAAKFFELSAKVAEVFKSMDDISTALDYQKIWEAVNIYTQQEGIDLADSDAKVDGMLKAVTDIIELRRANDAAMAAPKIEWFGF
jgi:uncharacterized protein YoxC